MGRPPSTVSGIERRRWNTDVMRPSPCANGWLVDACRRDDSGQRSAPLRRRRLDRAANDCLDTKDRSHGSITWSARSSSGPRDGETEGLRGLEVDHQLELRGLLDRQLARLRAPEDLVDIDGGVLEE